MAFRFRRSSTKIDFQDGSHGGHLGLPTETILAVFDLQVSPIFPSKFESVGLLVQEKKRKIDFEDGDHVGFPIKTILAIFDLQVTKILPTKFQVSWLFNSGDEGQSRFSRWPPWQPSWVSDKNQF